MHNFMYLMTGRIEITWLELIPKTGSASLSYFKNIENSSFCFGCQRKPTLILGVNMQHYLNVLPHSICRY